MRSRAISFIINTVTKKSIVDTNNLKSDQDENATKETIAKCILSNYLKKSDITSILNYQFKTPVSKKTAAADQKE